MARVTITHSWHIIHKYFSHSQLLRGKCVTSVYRFLFVYLQTEQGDWCTGRFSCKSSALFYQYLMTFTQYSGKQLSRFDIVFHLFQSRSRWRRERSSPPHHSHALVMQQQSWQAHVPPLHHGHRHLQHTGGLPHGHRSDYQGEPSCCPAAVKVSWSLFVFLVVCSIETFYCITTYLWVDIF